MIMSGHKCALQKKVIACHNLSHFIYSNPGSTKVERGSNLVQRVLETAYSILNTFGISESRLDEKLLALKGTETVLGNEEASESKDAFLRFQRFVEKHALPARSANFIHYVTSMVVAEVVGVRKQCVDVKDIVGPFKKVTGSGPKSNESPPVSPLLVASSQTAVQFMLPGPDRMVGIDVNPSSVPVSRICQEVINQSAGNYKFSQNMDGQRIQGQIECKYPVTLHPLFEKLEGFGYEWVTKLMVSGQDSKTQKKSGEPDLLTARKMLALQKTNISLLGATTLPQDVSENGLKLCVALNAWLFLNDNLFDVKDSAFRNPSLASAVFALYKLALEEKPIRNEFKQIENELKVLSLDHWEKIMVDIRMLVRGMREIGELLYATVESLDQKVVGQIQSAVMEGLKRYEAGNINESKRRSDTKSASGTSLVTFIENRDNSGAVDFVFEAAFAAANIVVPDLVRANEFFREILNRAKIHICLVNDIFSRNKEKLQGFSENLLIILERNSLPSIAIEQVLDQIRLTTGDIDSSERKFNEYLGSDSPRLTAGEILAARTAVQVIKNWVVGHIVWELASFEGRHPKDLLIDLSKLNG